MPWGSRPSIAALTRSGARKASEIVMLTFRALHPCRFAIVSALAAGSLVSSSSQLRPRAIDATSFARVSEPIGRAVFPNPLGEPAVRALRLIVNQFKALFVARIVRRGHPRFSTMIEGVGAKIHRSLARNIPEQIRYGFPRPPSIVIKNYCEWNSSTQDVACGAKLLRLTSVKA